MKEHSYEYPEAPGVDLDLLGKTSPVKVNGLGMNGSNRNKPCPCDSGKKRKKCCGNKPFTKEISESSEVRDPRYDGVSQADYPKGITSTKEDPRSKCNVTACQSTDDVNYKNNWNRDLWYCHSCFLDHTDCDISYYDGYRYEQAEPHPLLTPYRMLDHGHSRLRNNFVRRNGIDPINGDASIRAPEDIELYTWFWIKEDGTEIPVPYGGTKCHLIVFEDNIFDGTARVLVEPRRHKGIKEFKLNVFDTDDAPGTEHCEIGLIDPNENGVTKAFVSLVDYDNVLLYRLRHVNFVRLSDGAQFRFASPQEMEL